MGEWTDVELNKKLFKNIDEDVLTTTFGALENGFVTESNGISRFPGLKLFCNFGGNGQISMSKYNTDMIAVGTDGVTHRVDSNGNFEKIEGDPVLGGKKATFGRTRNGLMMAGGSQIIKFDGVRNSVLSRDAPLAEFIGFIDGYLLAVEKESGRFQYSNLNNFTQWPGENTFGVDGAPDDISAMIITPFNEILFAGEESIEQYERYVGGNVPFFRRWSIAEGISEPRTLCFIDNAAWGLNDRYEFVRMSGQTSQSVSDDIQKDLEDKFNLSGLSNLNSSWAAPINIKGQKFILFQAPASVNAYGTIGFTAIFDIRRGQWFEIFGWDEDIGMPTLWPGCSVFRLWGRTFVGGNGKIYEIDSRTYSNDGMTQRVYVRTAHFDTLGPIRIDGVRLTLKRGVGTYDFNPKVWFRTNLDHKGFNLMQVRELGHTGTEDMIIEFGAQGIGDTYQFEIGMTDPYPFELRRLQLNVTRVLR